jgi:hypothetical protein
LPARYDIDFANFLGSGIHEIATMVRVFWIRFFKNCRNAQFEWVSALSQRVADLRSEVEWVVFGHAPIVSGWAPGRAAVRFTGTRRAPRPGGPAGDARDHDDEQAAGPWGSRPRRLPPTPEVGSPTGGATRVNAAAATVELIVSMTGMPDDVGNIVMPGAFESSLPRRQPKVVLGHD